MAGRRPDPPSGEDALIDWLRREAGELGETIGDDLATLAVDGDIALKVDQQIAGTHYPADLDPALVASRLLAVNLSDLAAGSAQPVGAMLALAAPADYDHRRFFRSLLNACRHFDVALLGGDLARSPVASASLTLLGRRPARGRWVSRSAGRPGDRLWLGGPVGRSALGRELVRRGARIRADGVALPAETRLDRPLASCARRAVRAHLQPQPQLELGYWLGKRRRAAAIDVSDGVALDLARLCRASGTGARLDATTIVLPAIERRLAQDLELDPEALPLGGGEDYVLLFALPPDVKAPAPAVQIGEMTADQRLEITATDGHVRELEPLGWDHLRA
jgi:thiamine-monophosphate kinase